MRGEDQPLLINNEKSPPGISKSFLLLLGAFVVLLVACSVTLGVLYYQSLQTLQQNKVYHVLTGDTILLQSGFSQLAGYKVGLITNPTAVVNNVHIIDWMFFTPNTVNMSLVALFGPEHGLRGTGAAGEDISNSVDERTGLPIYSLYGNASQRAPSPAELANVTALVFDIQDTGCRFYTYISTLGLCMQSAAAAGIPFFVLDRPNPIGSSASGWILDPHNASFIGEYTIPVQYGLTIGELATMIQGEQLLPGLANLSLTIIQMQGYSDGIYWSDTTLPFISPSPNMVDLTTAYLYPGTGFFEAFNGATEGRGTLMPFKLIGAPWINSTQLVQQLQSYGLPGVSFSPAQFIPTNISDMSGVPKFLNQMVYGVQIDITDHTQIRAVELGVYMVYTFYQLAPADQKANLIDPDDMALHAGTPLFYEAIVNGTLTPDQIIQQWKAPLQLYMQSRKPYLLY